MLYDRLYIACVTRVVLRDRLYDRYSFLCAPAFKQQPPLFVLEESRLTGAAHLGPSKAHMGHTALRARRLVH
jgi:hypothetical protein